MQSESIGHDEQAFYKVVLRGFTGHVWNPRYVFTNRAHAVKEAKRYDPWFEKDVPTDAIRMWEATIEVYDVMPNGILMFDELPDINTGVEPQNYCPLPCHQKMPHQTMAGIWHSAPVPSVKERVKKYLEKQANKA